MENKKDFFKALMKTKYGDSIKKKVEKKSKKLPLSLKAIGMAALAGQKPIVELQFYDFVYPALDQLTTEAAKYHWKAGKAVPMVVRGPTGAGTRSGPFHSISPESLLAHHPGIKVVAPSNP